MPTTHHDCHIVGDLALGIVTVVMGGTARAPNLSGEEDAPVLPLAPQQTVAVGVFWGRWRVLQ